MPRPHGCALKRRVGLTPPACVPPCARWRPLWSLCTAQTRAATTHALPPWVSSARTRPPRRATAVAWPACSNSKTPAATWWPRAARRSSSSARLSPPGSRPTGPSAAAGRRRAKTSAIRNARLHETMKNPARNFLRFGLPLLVMALAVAAAAVQVVNAQPSGTQTAAQPALAVTLIQPLPAQLPIRIASTGNIAAWQEASVGTQANGLMLNDVRVNVGDSVRRGQVLAIFDAAPVAAEFAHSRAALAEAEAALGEAVANGQRARDLQASGALSAQQINQYLTAERMAQARVAAA